MSTVRAVADVHIGNHKRFGGPVEASINARCRLVLASLEAAVRRVVEDAPDVFVIAGDLLDYARPEAPVLAEVQRILGLLAATSTRTAVLVGNHDQTSTAPGDHALGPLAVVPGVTVVERPTALLPDVWAVPFQPGHAKDWLSDAVRGIVSSVEAAGGRPAPPGRPRLLTIHLGIRDEKTPPWLASSADAIDLDVLVGICKEHGITHVMAGNWHDRRTWNVDGVRVFQLGALVPTGWDNPGLEGYGTLGAWDSGREAFKWQEIPGPRFVKTRTSAELDTVLAKAMGGPCHIFLSDAALPEDVGTRSAQLAAAQATYPKLAGFEVVPDETFAKAEAREAASAARSAETFEQALEDFVANMPLPEHVRREAVLDRVRRYVK